MYGQFAITFFVTIDSLGPTKGRIDRTSVTVIGRDDLAPDVSEHADINAERLAIVAKCAHSHEEEPTRCDEVTRTEVVPLLEDDDEHENGAEG